jgi:hypothetical protein
MKSFDEGSKRGRERKKIDGYGDWVGGLRVDLWRACRVVPGGGSGGGIESARSRCVLSS